MKKKYQVFISSTYSDLVEERAAVTQCLLDNQCIPVGMEQFPASELSQMEYIQRMLDDCDYYILILGGRYGSLDRDGVGFTEKEYDYAISRGLPVMSFVYEKPENLQSKNCEKTDDMRLKYNSFREKVCRGRLVKFHTDVGGLKANVATAINQCIRDFPAIGWIRGDSTNGNGDLERIFEKHLREYAAIWEELDDIMQDNPPVSNIQNEKEKMSPKNEQAEDRSSEITLSGIKATVEELANRIPKISMGDTPPKQLENGEIYLQYE